MTCNRCSAVSNEAAKAVGAPEVEATWAENRDHPRFCPTCHGFLRVDGGCTKCEGMSVSSDGEMALAMPAEGIEMLLSCGHSKQTSVSPGDEEWCTECDDWMTVELPEPMPSSSTPATTPIVPFTPRTTALSAPPDWWSFRRRQLWDKMEKVAQGKEITVVGHWTGFANSSGKGNGKVYGGFYGRGKDGKWYSAIAYGPIDQARVKGIQTYDTEYAALRHYHAKKQEKLDNGQYTSQWPCDHNAMPLLRKR